VRKWVPRDGEGPGSETWAASRSTVLHRSPTRTPAKLERLILEARSRLVGIWTRVGVPAVAQFDNHATFRGGIPPAWQHFSPIMATCLDLEVTARFIPLREPWRNGIVEHFYDMWHKSFFRTGVFTSIDHLRAENTAFIEFHNTHHRYPVHGGTSPDQIWQGRLHRPLSTAYRRPDRLPAPGRIEVIRFIWSNGATTCSTGT